MPFRRIAEAIGRQLGLPSRSISTRDAEAHFGGIAMFVAGNSPASSARTREAPGWVPRAPDLIWDIERTDYSA